MNQKLTGALRRQQIRQMHHRIILEARLLREESLYATFVEPFTDVLDAAKLTTKDLLNIASLSWDTLFTMNPNKLREAREGYEKREAEIAKEWEPILKRNREAGGTDADILAMVLAPEVFILSEAAMQIWDKTENIYEFLDESGWRLPLSSLIVGKKLADTPSKSAGGKEKGILERLRGLFFLGTSESVFKPDLPLLVEQEEQKPDLKTAFRKFTEQTGLDVKIKDSSKKMVEAQKEYFEKAVTPLVVRLQLINSLEETADPEEFVSLIEGAASKGLELEAAGFDTMVQQIKEDAKKLAQSEEFQQQLKAKKAQTGEASDEPLDPAEVEPAALKVVFASAKQNFDQQLGQGKERLKETGEQIMEDMTQNEATSQALKTTKEGEEVLGLINAAKQQIEDS
jgi:hypothetical protein